MLLDADNGFGGLANQILQHLSDEYPRKTRFAFPLLPAMRLNDPTDVDYNMERNRRLVNTGLVLESLFEHSSMFSPLSLDSSWASNNFRKFQHVQYKVKMIINFFWNIEIAPLIDSDFIPAVEFTVSYKCDSCYCFGSDHFTSAEKNRSPSQPARGRTGLGLFKPQRTGCFDCFAPFLWRYAVGPDPLRHDTAHTLHQRHERGGRSEFSLARHPGCRKKPKCHRRMVSAAVGYLVDQQHAVQGAVSRRTSFPAVLFQFHER